MGAMIQFCTALPFYTVHDGVDCSVLPLPIRKHSSPISRCFSIGIESLFQFHKLPHPTDRIVLYGVHPIFALYTAVGGVAKVPLIAIPKQQAATSVRIAHLYGGLPYFSRWKRNNNPINEQRHGNSKYRETGI